MAIFKRNTSNNKDINTPLEAILNQSLYTVPDTKNSITWADAIEGTLILGNTGSGKSSGPGKYIASKMLSSGFGFCVLCAKSDEAERWIRYAQDNGRSDDVVLFNKESGLEFNFLKYEMERKGRGSGEILNILNMLMTLNEQSKIHQGGGDIKEERFWDNAVRRMISRTISLLDLANENVSISNMRAVVSQCFKNDQDTKQYDDLKRQIISDQKVDVQQRKDANEELNTLRQESYFINVIEHLFSKQFDNELEENDAIDVIQYWLKELPRISERTTSIIVESYLGIIEPFSSRGILKNQFSTGLSEELKPENIVEQNKIVIVDFSLKEYGLPAVYAATIYKTAFQTAMERRDLKTEDNPKPVGLWVDEYQSFCSPLTDSLFQLTARSSWVATIYITQNINNIYFVMGSHMPEARAKSLLGNLNLKYFCSNPDAETNEWASKMIGEHIATLDTYSYVDKQTATKTETQQIQPKILPSFFTQLKTGREHNDFIVESIIFKSGKIWRDSQDDIEDNYAIVGFDQ